MARRKSPVEFAAYIIAVAGPLGLYLAHKASVDAPTPLDMPETAAELDLSSEPDGPLIPVQAPAPVAPTEVAAPAGVGADLEFALVSNGRLILRRAVPEAWGAGEIGAGSAGEPSERYPENYHYAEKAADHDVIPEGYAELVGKRVDLYGAGGAVCTAEIRSIAVVAEVNGDAWYLFEGLEEGEQIVTDDEGHVTPAEGRRIRQLTYDYADRWLMASYVPSEGSAGNDACEGALFGRGSALPAPKMLTPRKGTVARSVKDGFLANAAVELRADYETYIEASDLESGESPDWASLVKTTYGRTVYVDGAGRPTFVYQRVGDYDSSCGDGFGDYHSDLSGLSSTDPRRVPAQRFRTAPALLVDGDGDGKFEVIGGDYDVTYYDEDGDYLYTAQRPYEGCPC